MNYPRLVLAAISALITFFAWGFLTEGWLLRKDFAVSAALYRTSDAQMKFMPFGLASVLVALLAAVVIYARWCGGTSGAASGLQFGIRAFLQDEFLQFHLNGQELEDAHSPPITCASAIITTFANIEEALQATATQRLEPLAEHAANLVTDRVRDAIVNASGLCRR